MGMRKSAQDLAEWLVAKLFTQGEMGLVATFRQAIEDRDAEQAFLLGSEADARFGQVEAQHAKRVIALRREVANAAGAMLRDAAREHERTAEEHAREEASAVVIEETNLELYLAHELEKLSQQLYALGDPPKPMQRITVEDDGPEF